MAKKTTTIMTDAMGNDVPIRYVSQYDRTRDCMTRRIHARWVKARQALEKVMTDSLADMETIAKARGAAGIDVAGEKGNMQVSSFDGNITCSLVVRYDIYLDDRVKQARDLMLDYARSLANQLGGSDGQALLSIIDEAFQVTSTGSLSISRVLSLMRRDIKAAQWQEAKRLLSESMETRRGKSYLRVEVRQTRQHDPEAIRLDIADCWPKEVAQP